jgi:hypothetical protein
VNKKQALLKQLSRKEPSALTVSVNDLNGLLLQISLAIMMIFVMAYFIFRTQKNEKILEIQRQKLELAVETVDKEYKVRYGLNVLTSGLTRREGSTNVYFDASSIITNGAMTQNHAIRAAFISASQNGQTDFADKLALRKGWWDKVMKAAALDSDITQENTQWLNDTVDTCIADYVDSVHAIQYGCATMLQKYWSEHPQQVKDEEIEKILTKFNTADEKTKMLLITDLAEALRRYSIETLSKLAGAELLQ